MANYEIVNESGIKVCRCGECALAERLLFMHDGYVMCYLQGRNQGFVRNENWFCADGVSDKPENHVE